ncbi:peroxisomal succinyl-coenzyme A thioesterase-like [Myxocyprinus asiaticus]|uniref:peroxisomal succinyl-coenzyme A thioesterase-like n=1 Tax=Myxocyprinus asiaticus TaxID=70543 RepID=UPI002223353F|nr:peroxisomal succinyl-coenzyme A thioesterase-like [Myxocyprinus asiaticus]
MTTVSTETGTCPMLSVQPNRGLVDEKFQVSVTNLLPNQEVTLHSLHLSEEKDFWEVFGHYISDEHGTVKVARKDSLGGTYKGTEPMGLLWSMRPVPGSILKLHISNILKPMIVLISVYEGHLTQGFSQKAPLATSITERWYIAPGVQRVDVREKGKRGTLFLPPGPGPFPGVLDLWGGGGDLVEYLPSLLASHGFASLALEYFSPKKLNTADVDTSYFEKAYQILQNHPMVQKDCLAVLGLCFGSAITLSLVAYSEVIKPQCCVCISGGHMLLVDKSLFDALTKRKSEHTDKIRVNEDNQIICRDILLSIPTDPTLKADVGRIKCPLLLVTAGDDQTWPAVECAEDMEMMMLKAGNGHLLEVLTYPEAGHLIEPPYSPHFRATNFNMQGFLEIMVMLWGGQTKPHSYAQEDAWKKILSFMRQHLYFSSTLY